jgi:hypothetical protein
MKMIFSRIFFFLFAMSLFLYGAESMQECEEQVLFAFDGRDWDQAYDATKGDTSIIEFVPKGDDIDNWSELVSIQKLSQFDATVDEYYDAFIDEMKKEVSPDEVNSKVISKDDDKSIFFEWWINEGKNAQHEWFKLIKTPQSVLVLRYTTKKMDDVENVRSTWEKILSESSYQLVGDCPPSDNEKQ